jgi:hypothetical protein
MKAAYDEAPPWSKVVAFFLVVFIVAQGVSEVAIRFIL